MEKYNLNVESQINGGYFSSEQIDLLSIIQCNSPEELIHFINNCDQINRVKEIEKIIEKISKMDLESSKRTVFELYQSTMVYHNQSKEDSKKNRLKYFQLSSEEEANEEILELNHHFVSDERDQNKDPNLYDELVQLNNELPNFNSMLIGSGKIYNVVNKNINNTEKKFDFYHAKRDLAFAQKNGKQVRFHSLLVKEDCGQFDGKSKEEILELIKDYVKASIDFINEYNETHKVIINGKEEPIINAVDLFNEIVSFNKMIYDKETNKWYEYKKIGNEYKVVIDSKNKIYRDLKEGEVPEYQNIWHTKYGISMPELLHCFDYALQNKPNGVSYLYNEPFLEDDERRQKVFEMLSEIDTLRPGLIDTLGSQMHITITQDISNIERCFRDFKNLQERKGKKIQITEFDMSIGSADISRVFGPDANVTLEQVYEEKGKKIQEISNVINSSGVKLSGISYWSLTDGIDCNLERIRSNHLGNYQIPTVCGGLIPTYKKLIKQQQLNQMLNEKSNQTIINSNEKTI